jgi:molybdopterin/thiamine biosynthesis adenylyltransferase
MKVGVIGAGGVGSLVVEYLGRLGVGSFVIADPQRVELTNVPRITGATRWDARAILTRRGVPAWLRALGERWATPKVAVMRRLIRRANPDARVEAIMGDFVDNDVARRFVDCDYLFLAADTMQARLVFNAIVHAYLIPGVQMGAKVVVDAKSGDVGDVFSVSRPVTPSGGCLLCNSLISPSGLQREAENAAERRSQRYVDDEGVAAPSVITLNAQSASHAVNDFLFAVTGLRYEGASVGYLRSDARRRRTVVEEPRRDLDCPQCGVIPGQGAFARGDAAPLYTRSR